MSKLNVYEDIEDYVSYSDYMPTKVYDKAEVDAAIAEKDAEIRRLGRALWAYRAMIAKKLKNSFGIRALYDPLPSTEEHKWEVVERKCRAKAEEYK